MNVGTLQLYLSDEAPFIWCPRLLRPVLDFSGLHLPVISHCTLCSVRVFRFRADAR